MDSKFVEPMAVMYAEQELSIPEVGHYGAKFGAEFMAEVEKHVLRVAGPWVFISYKLPKNGKDRYRMEFCLPISNEENYKGGRFPIKSLDGFPCAFAEYKGKLRQLFTKGYQPLVQEMIAANMRFTGESREIYHAWFGPDSPENRIEIQFGVA